MVLSVMTLLTSLHSALKNYKNIALNIAIALFIMTSLLYRLLQTLQFILYTLQIIVMVEDQNAPEHS